MKATLDIPDDLYKRVKARSAMEGKPIRSVAIELFQIWIQTPSDTGVENESVSLSTEDYKKYPWLELARKYKKKKGQEKGSVPHIHIFTYLNEEWPCSSWPEFSTRRNCG